MWTKALVGVPRVTPQEWNELNIITKWLIATRAGVLIMTFFSSSIAGIFAYRSQRFDFNVWLIVTLGLLFAHATNNLLNDFTDWFKGVDEGNYFRMQYGTHPMSVMSKGEMIRYILTTGMAASLCGLYLVYLRGEVVLYFALAGSFFLLFYTYPLKFIGMGGLSVLIVWGLLMVGGGFYTISNQWDWYVVWAGLPYSLGVTSVIFGKHMDKLSLDRTKRIFTLPVLLGDAPSRFVATLLMVSMYLCVIYLVIVGFFSPIMLIVLGALPTLATIVPIFSKARPVEPPKDFPPNVWPLYFVAASFRHNRIFGSLFLLGLLLDTAWVRMEEGLL